MMTFEEFIKLVVNDDTLNEMEKIEKIAYKQWIMEKHLVEFEYKGIAITYPWMEESGCFDVENPAKYYGKKNFNNFCNGIIKLMIKHGYKKGGF